MNMLMAFMSHAKHKLANVAVHPKVLKISLKYSIRPETDKSQGQCHVYHYWMRKCNMTEIFDVYM